MIWVIGYIFVALCTTFCCAMHDKIRNKAKVIDEGCWMAGILWPITIFVGVVFVLGYLINQGMNKLVNSVNVEVKK